MDDFEPNSVNLFRAVFEPTFSGNLEEADFDSMKLPDYFNLQLEVLKSKRLELSDLSAR